MNVMFKTIKALIIFFSQIKQNWNSCDFLVHSVAFSDKNELKGSYVKTSRENFLNTLNVSCYSFRLYVKELQI